MPAQGSTATDAGPGPREEMCEQPLERLRMLSDAPLSDDRRDFFGYGVYADTIAELIGSEGTDTPLALAISGPWGAGKTSLARMIADRLRARSQPDDRQNLVCWFNAWMHDDAPHLGAAMAACVATVAARNRPWWRTLIEPLPSAMVGSRDRWRRRLGIGVASWLIVFTALSISPVRRAVESIDAIKQLGAPTGSIAALVFLVVLLAPRLYSAFERAAHFIDDPASEAARGSIAEVRGQLGRLIRQALYNRRLIVFVDDLERCAPARAMEVCEVANQLLSHANVVTVFVADMQLIAKAAEDRFQDASSGGNAGRRYLEKIVQLQLTLPSPKTVDLEHLMDGHDPGDGGRTPLGRSQTSDEELRSPSALFGTLSDVPFLIAQDPPIGVPSFVLGAVLGSRVAFLSGAIPQAAADQHASVEWLLGIPARASGSTVLAVSAFAFEGATLTCMIVAALLRVHRRHRSHRKREEIKKLINDEIDRTARRRPLEDAVIEALRAKRKNLTLEERNFTQALVRSYLLDHAPELDDVERVILQVPPNLPRGAKRMLNHARLLTQIARARKLFDGDPGLAPAHLGAWIVLGERWPSIARRVEQDPLCLGRLQALAQSPDALERVVGEAGEGQVTDLAKLLTKDPLLGAVATRLVHFE